MKLSFGRIFDYSMVPTIEPEDFENFDLIIAMEKLVH